MIVMKFGGTSVNSVQKIQTIAHIIKQHSQKSPVVVVSAFRGVTDMLLQVSQGKNISWEELKRMHMRIVKEVWVKDVPLEIEGTLDSYIQQMQTILKNRKQSLARTDSVIAYGEIISSFLVSRILQYYEISSMQLVATNLIVTNNHFGSADFLSEETSKQTKRIVLPLIEKGIVPVVTGFIGATKNGQTTTLGRGGSDYSASIIASCLGVDEIQFWKDVDGVYTADPRKEKNAKLLQTISYQEITNLLQAGAHILHPQTISPVSSIGIPIRVMNTLHPQGQGTLIRNEQEQYL